MKNQLSIAAYLAVKEIIRNRGRFLLVSLVIALITLLVLFIAALGEGLGNGNREYLANLDGQLVVYQAKSDFIISASRLSRDRLASVRRVNGVADAGLLATASGNLILPEAEKPLKLALLGVEIGHTGEPPVVQGRQLATDLAKEVILDRQAALRSGFKVGDYLTIRTTQGTKDEFYDLRVVGISSGQQYGLQPSVFISLPTWDRIRPKSEAEASGSSKLVGNVILVRLDDPRQALETADRITSQVDKVEVATIAEAINALPGYSAQQSTLNTQGSFTLFIGVLVIGGFFQIQILQKIAQIGVLKAIGATNTVVAAASLIQITLVTIIGVAIGGFLSFLFSLTFPPTVPIVFNGGTTVLALVALLLIGPLGGFVSIRYAVRIEPLKALGLSV